jgi:hypothetical protein
MRWWEERGGGEESEERGREGDREEGSGILGRGGFSLLASHQSSHGMPSCLYGSVIIIILFEYIEAPYDPDSRLP